MAILALDPAYGLTKSKPALVWLEPNDDGFDIEWITFRPKKKDLDERYHEIMEEINSFANVCDIDTIRTLAVYKTAFGGAALGLTHLIGMYLGWGFMLGIPGVVRVQDSTVRAAIAGNGNATPDAMYRAVKAQWPNAPKKHPDVIAAAALALHVARGLRK